MHEKDAPAASPPGRDRDTAPMQGGEARARRRWPSGPSAAEDAGASPPGLEIREVPPFLRTKASLGGTTGDQYLNSDGGSETSPRRSDSPQNGRRRSRLLRLTVAASLGLGVFVALQQVGSDASEERDVAAQGPEEQNPITAASRSREIEAALPPKAGLPPRVATERWKVIGDRIVAVSPTEINKSAGEVFQPAPLELQDAEARKGRPTAEWRVRRAATSKAQPAKAFGQRRVGAGSKASTTQVELTPTEQEIVRDLADAGAKLMSSADRAPPPGSASRTTLAESKMAGAAVVPKLKVAPPSPSRSTQVLQRQIFSKDVASAQAVGAPRPLFPASLWGPPRTTSGADQEAPGDPTFGVQLVSVSDEQRALLAWQAYKREFDPALDGLEPVIESARLLDRTVFRVRAVAFTERAEAEAVCAQLQQQGADCLVFRR